MGAGPAHLPAGGRYAAGHPAGSRLAAPAVPAEIAAEIAAHCLDFLEGDWQDLPERQRSLRAVFDYSWSLLEREQHIFAGLSVFRGGFTLPGRPAGERGEPARPAQAGQHSLLERTPSGRYELHELLRQFAEQRLGELPQMDPSIRDRHMETYLDVLRRLTADLQGPRQIEALAEMDLELGNIQSAWSRAVASRQVRLLAEGMQGLGLYYDRRIRFIDGATFFQQSVDGLTPGEGSLEPETAPVRAYLQAWQGYFIYPLGQVEAGYKAHAWAVWTVRKAAAAGQDVRRYQAHSQMLIDFFRKIIFQWKRSGSFQPGIASGSE